ncbi:MAG: GNAT family N-acetyltransferase [Candidatus Heimdallarchaeota archaeon]|nr:GNAT family N-acetyltransferase [Candidatus Heimdallarchaeota archaeon]
MLLSLKFVSTISYYNTRCSNLFEIQSFNSKKDYKAIIEINNLVWPIKYTLDDLKQADQNRDPNRFFKRIVAIVRKKVVGYGIVRDPWEFTDPGYYAINLTVHPNYRRKGIGDALYEQLIKSLQHYQVDTIIAETYENMTDAVEFLEKRGFQITIRLPRSILHLEEFHPQRFDSILEKVSGKGIRIVTVSKLATKDKNWKHKLWRLHVECMKDVPSTVELTEMPFEQYKQNVLDKLDLDYWVVALDGSELVGLSILWRDTAELEKMYTSLTGVIRSHRRQKIATAMKIKLF